jgi:prolyl oligopeptidase
MGPLMSPPFASPKPVTELLHGVPITDPYRWLEDQNSPETRAWIEQQTLYTRAYLDSIPGRDRIRLRVRELLDVETYCSFLKCGSRYFFRKRLPGEEQPSIYFREGPNGSDELLIDPARRGTGNYTAVKPLRVSSDGNLLLYEVKHGGEREGTFELFDVKNRRILPDSLPHGFLRGFAFTPSSRSFYYVHEATTTKRPFYRSALHHVLGTSRGEDQEVFCAGEDEKLRLVIVPGRRCLGLLVYHFLDKVCTDFYLLGMGVTGSPVEVLRGADYTFLPFFLDGRILAVTDRNAPNRRIVEVQPRKYPDPFLFDVVAECDRMIRSWALTAIHLLVTYTRGTRTEVDVFDFFGRRLGQIPCGSDETLQVVAGDRADDEILLERQSFTTSKEVFRYSASSGAIAAWTQCEARFDARPHSSIEVNFPSKDGSNIPMHLVGNREALSAGTQPLLMTAYGGFGVPMTPQFSVMISCLMERGCLFALPNIRGGSELGANWHNTAKRRNRQVAFDDFLSAAEWLILSGRTTAGKLAIFGGSNSGLLVATAITQRPELFRAVLCLVPMADMLRYHLFDNSHVWNEELGNAEDPNDFLALLGYSPYHRVQEGNIYPAVMIVSGDLDQNCNPLHARKLTARLQAASSPEHPILLDYHSLRGHSPVLPLSVRVEALTNRLTFLCDQLGLAL